MNQYLEQLIFSSMVVWVAVFSFLYGCGGIHNNWLRRYLGTAWMMGGVVVFSLWLGCFHWAYLTFWPIAIGGCIIGYGKGELGVRLGRRALQGLAYGVSPAAMAIYQHAWGAWAFDIGLAITSCVVIGGLNVFANARKNEVLVATLSFLLVLFMVSKP